MDQSSSTAVMSAKFLCAALCFLAATVVGIECKTKFSGLPPALWRLPKFRSVHDEKIVGGEEVEPHSIPHQVSVQVYRGENWCGGSIITNKSVLTAARCCDGQAPDYIDVVAGEHNLNKDEGTEQVVGVKKFVVHPNFDFYSGANDICVIVLKEELKFNEAVGPCTLPKQGQKFTGDAVVSGWGPLTYGGNLPDALQAVTVPLVSDKECRQDYGAEAILDSMICAGEAGKDSCFTTHASGDSGGPMTCNGTHCGIVSWGTCGEPGFPGLYTETSHYVSFIKKVM